MVLGRSREPNEMTVENVVSLSLKPTTYANAMGAVYNSTITTTSDEEGKGADDEATSSTTPQSGVEEARGCVQSPPPSPTRSMPLTPPAAISDMPLRHSSVPGLRRARFTEHPPPVSLHQPSIVERVWGERRIGSPSTAGRREPVELTRWRRSTNADNQILPNGRTVQDNAHLSAAHLQQLNASLPPPPTFAQMERANTIRPMATPMTLSSSVEAKGCCGGRYRQSSVIRAFIVTISVIGVVCVIVGIVLGALTVSGGTRLTLCLVMIAGVGAVLFTVSGIAWRLTRTMNRPMTDDLRALIRAPNWALPNVDGATVHLGPYDRMSGLDYHVAMRTPPPTYCESVRHSTVDRPTPILETAVVHQVVVQGPQSPPPPAPATSPTASSVRSPSALSTAMAMFGTPPPEYTAALVVRCSTADDSSSLVDESPPTYVSNTQESRVLPSDLRPHIRSQSDVVTSSPFCIPRPHVRRSSVPCVRPINIELDVVRPINIELDVVRPMSIEEGSISVIDCSLATPRAFNMRRHHRRTKSMPKQRPPSGGYYF